ncbi:hypothetical protein [Clostridium oceanicum]|uniref:DUF1266 domain-containing protein n=1 Tax=Clostridium oceanicum TaxID=1543 RepID=A0ABP3V160_9CLOT
MVKYNKDDNLYFTCCLLEYIARKTLNETEVIVNYLGEEGISWIHEYADVLHCENIDAVTHELVERYNIQDGDYHCDKYCEEYDFELTSVWAIGAVFARLIEDIGNDTTKTLIEVYNSYIGKCINNYLYGFYTSSPQIIYGSYKAGEMLD